jgi:hypothetical protein
MLGCQPDKRGKIEQVEEALDGELAQVNNRLRSRQATVHNALSELVCRSPDFHDLFAELEQA